MGTRRILKMAALQQALLSIQLKRHRWPLLRAEFSRLTTNSTMQDFRQQYKTLGFRGVQESRRLRTIVKGETRKQQRSNAFNDNRNIPRSTRSVSQTQGARKEATANENRLTRLKLWQAEKERQRKKERMKKKPPFTVGVVHHKLFSPAGKYNVGAAKAKVNTSASATGKPEKKISGVTAKRLKAKEAESKEKLKQGSKLANPLKGKSQRTRQIKQSIAPADYKFKAPAGLMELPLFGKSIFTGVDKHIINFAFSPVKRFSKRVSKSQERRMEIGKCLSPIVSLIQLDKRVLKSPVEEKDLTNETESSTKGVLNKRTPKRKSVVFSPYKGSSRGRSKGRKERLRGLGKSPGVNTSVESEERTARYFESLVNEESERLRELCLEWEEIKAACEGVEDAQYQINQAVGQTRLLLNKKFESFRDLIRDCESGKGEMLVTCKDLEGFWDMMYREVKDCDARFQKLGKSRLANWVEEKETIKPVVRKKTAPKKKIVASKPSGIRALIMAVRKQKVSSSQSSSNKSASNQSETSFTLRMNSPVVRHYTRRSRRSTVDKLKKTASARKSSSKIGKGNSEPEQTSGKSILKRSKRTKDLDSSVKSSHKVDFDDTMAMNEVTVDEEIQTKLDLAAALERIENFDFDTSREQLELAVDRKLNFDSDSFDETENILDKLEQQEKLEKRRSFHNKNLKIPLITSQESIPMKEIKEKPRKSLRRRSTVPVNLEHARSPLSITDNQNTTLPRRSRSRSQKATDEDAHNESIRILRSRRITTQEAPRTPRRKSSTIAPNSDQKENATPSKRGRKNSVKASTKDEHRPKMDWETTMDVPLNESVADKPRRWTRFSVKFADEDSAASASGKPKVPGTPHVRRSKLLSSEKRKPT